MKTPILMYALLACALVLSACQPAQPNQPVACTMDAKICPDGTAVGREGPNCEFAACPEPNTETPSLGTFKQYMSQDPDMCSRIRYTCDGDEAFSDDTGCGCVRQHNEAAVTLCPADVDPVCGWSGPEIQCFVYPCAQTYNNLCMASIDPNVAYTTPGACPAPGSVPTPPTVTSKYTELAEQYSISLGAKLERCTSPTENIYVVSGSGGFTGVDVYFDADGKEIGKHEWDDMIIEGQEEPVPPRDLNKYTCTVLQTTIDTGSEEGEGKLEAIDCPAERQTACTREYMPVCGQSVLNSGAIATKTYSNKCEACAQMKVVSYTVGACGATDGSAGSPSNGGSNGKKVATDCTDPRPEACTMEYNPVCGQKDGGEKSTYGNACSACADADVISHYAGACEGDSEVMA